VFQIDPDIRKAKTLPSEFYTDERFFELSKEKIFARTWQYAGRVADLATLTPLELLGEPLLLVRNADGVRCMSNVCTHRGKILIDEACDANLIRCGYHGRRFSLDGKFLSMPEFEGVENFPSEADDLTSVAVGEAGGFAFVSLDPIAELAEFVSDESMVPLGSGELKLTSTREYRVNAHWALYCENYLEGFHIPFVHKSLNEVVDYGTYSTELSRYSSMQTGYDADGNVAGRYAFIFPNTDVQFLPLGRFCECRQANFGSRIGRRVSNLRFG
jgi:choline monooxygenase